MDGQEDIEMESVSGSDSREEDEDYNVDGEEDKGEPEDQAHDQLLKSMDHFEKTADNAPPIQEDEVTIRIPQAHRKRQVPTKSKAVKKGGPKNNRERGPTKGLKVKEPMFLEYNAKGKPCGRWRTKYETQVGLCMRKLSILWSWNEVPEGLKKTLWEDTVNLFHIQPSEEKKNIFFSALAERFRDFKSKLVSGWITMRRQRTRAKKMRKETEKENSEGEENENQQRRESEEKVENEERRPNEEGNQNEEGRDMALEKNQAPAMMPYEIWGHITKDEWEAFVAKKTTLGEVEKRSKASSSANKKRYHHHMGPKTFDEKRKEWINEGFYPSLSSYSTTPSSSAVTGVKVDRVADWYCSLHGRDASGKRTISEPTTRKIADAVIFKTPREAPFTVEEIKEIRDKLALFITEFCL